MDNDSRLFKISVIHVIRGIRDEGWMDGWMDGWMEMMDGRTDGRMDGWMDG